MGGDVRIRIVEALEIHADALQVYPRIRRMREGPRAYRVQVDPAFQRPGVLFLLLFAIAARHVQGDRRKFVSDK
ncbi:hypothetical protein G6F64_015091 [Rhizopus arrhizus]|nr:hypothetical protein G6F64_015091 [Rhizopus arrhizus]